MGDLFLETLKTLTISRKTMLKKCSLTPETKALFDHYAKNKKSLILVLGHHGNWEWAGNAFGLQCKQPLYVIYHPLSNKPFNSLVIKMRTRFGTRLIEMKSTLRDMIAKRGEVNVTAFIADQSPTPEGAYWTTFLNQDTPIFKGAEKIARKLEYPVVYVSLDRYKRGYYKVNAQVLFENPGLTKENEISEKHTRILEKEILRQPETWLWSHRRWKHKRPAA